MPLYEEKLICPLAVRFTQEHIRPVFQDGRTLEETIKEIKQKPGIDEYDVILEVPFDPVEIIRWNKRDESGFEPKQRHWFTFDNRRLYCLQRCAVALWPKRVGTVVQALYAATDGSHRKDNSLTAGRCVWIGHSLKTLTDGWDWRDVAGCPMTKTSSGTPTAAVAAAAEGAKVEADDAAAKAHTLIARDDQRTGFPDLCDAPAPPSMLDLFFEGGGEEEDLEPLKPEAQHRNDSEDSTAVPSTPRSAVVSDESGRRMSQRGRRQQTQQQAQWGPAYTALSEGMCGEWVGDKQETYRVDATAQGWKVSRVDNSGGHQKKFTLWYDEASDIVWWGTQWTMYLQARELREKRGKVHWYGNNGSWKPWFVWAKKGAQQQQNQQPPGAKAPLQEGCEGEEEVAAEGAQAAAASPTGAAQKAGQRVNRGGQRGGHAPTRRGRRA